MKNLIYFLLGMLLLFSSCLNNNKQAKNYNNAATVDESGISFIKKGLEAGLTEVKAAKVAETNSKNQRILNFAKMMITDHTEAGDELEKIAIKQRVTASDSVSTEHQNKIMALSSKLGLEFDGPYMHMMVNDHEDAVKLFTAATQNKNPDIQNFAKKVLPTLQMHLDSAKAIVASLK
jgi:putative membrane protein